MAEQLTGLLSGVRCLSQEVLDARVRRVAAGFAALGVGRGACIAILMRNDIAFMEAAYAAQALGAYAVPINWHFKAEEIVYILADCATSVLIGHPHPLAPAAAATPTPTALTAAAPPPEVPQAYGLAPVAAAAVPRALNYEAWLERLPPNAPDMLKPSLTMFYTSGTTGHPKGVRRPAPTPQQMRTMERMRRDVFGILPGVRSVVPGP